jgi:ribosomal protein S18 acetylase RimI-like enzyme
MEKGPDGLPRSPVAGGAPGRRPPAAELYTLYVTPDHWSTGAGRALMDRVLTEVRAEGYPRVILWVLRDNRRARRFYERAGFRRKGTEHPSYFAGVPEVRYVRDL